MLVFLPTERDIRETAKTLRGRSIPGDGRQTEILPLYARLSASEQNKIFQPHGRRRIVLATNVAESSLTVPNIRFVVDTGTARISRYSPRRKVQRLPIEAISQASADQRAGRCGRVGPGICVRLYSEDDYLARERLRHAGDPPHQPGGGDPANQGVPAGSDRGVSVPRPAPRRRDPGRLPDAVRTGRDRRPAAN